MTSGIMQEVPDESVFIKYLVKRLDENEERFLSSELLFSSFKTAVMNNSSNVPQFGVIQNVGDEGGDFIFIKR
jgi:vacuolar-type H+-ATPase catalytic subunit A/Vma1